MRPRTLMKPCPAGNTAAELRPCEEPDTLSLVDSSGVLQSLCFRRWRIARLPRSREFWGLFCVLQRGIVGICSMHGRRFDRVLTGTAIALILGLGSLHPALAQTSPDQAAIEARVPIPEAANVPPPTAADIAAPEITGTTDAVNLPEPPDLPPPSFKEAAPA